jgi:DNA-binding MarR family transcriptional regulator
MDRLQPEQALADLEKIVRAVDLAFQEALAAGPTDLTRPEVRFLLAAGLAEGRPLKDLADRLGRSRPSVSLTADALVAKGYLDRAPGADRRQTVVRLTVRGWEVFREVRSGLVSRLGLAAWSESDLAHLAQISVRF